MAEESNFLNLIPIPVCQVDKNFNVLAIGKNFKETLGYKENEIIGSNLGKIFFDSQIFKEIGQKAKEEEKAEKKEIFLLSKDEKKILVDVFVAPKYDKNQNVGGFIFSFLDVSEKKKVEIELQKKIKDLQRFAKELKNSRVALLDILEDIEEARGLAEVERDKTLAIVENFLDGLLFFDQDNRLSSINPRAQEFFSVLSKDLTGKEFEELIKIPSIAPLLKILGENIGRVFKKELELANNLVLEISSVVVMSKEKKIGTLVILRDVTREKVIERLKTEFVSIAAHQLRTPLSAIKWTLRMILDGDIGEISKEQKDFLEKTYNSNERMIRLINDLLNVTRIEEGRFLYKTEAKDIIEISKKVLGPLKELAQRKGLVLKFEKPDKEIPKIKVDEEKIMLVFQNLVDNAIHYTDPKGEVKVSISFLEDKKEILVSVKDTGIGILKEQQERVFSRFFRGANAVRAETEGTGLGLYIAKNIIEAHGGKIWFESKERKGTTFYFTLPVR